MILAGGLGTRLRSVVYDVPKPMADVRGRPFLEYLMDYWIAQGITEFIVSVGYKRESIKAHFADRYSGIPVTYVEESQPLGTGGGLLLASQYISKPFLLLNGDSFFKVELFNLVAFHESMVSDLTMALFRANESDRYGCLEVNENGKIQAFQHEKSSIGALANGGVYYINPEILSNNNFIFGNKYSLENDILPKLIAQDKKLYGLEINTQFIDIGIPKDYLEAHNLLKKT